MAKPKIIDAADFSIEVNIFTMNFSLHPFIPSQETDNLTPSQATVIWCLLYQQQIFTSDHSITQQ